MRVRAEDKGLAFELDVRLDTPCWVRAIRSRLRQVLHNLLGNAVKFTQRGSISLSLAARRGQRPVLAEVRDSGPGIAADELAHVFEAFRQAGGPTRGRSRAPAWA